MSDSRTDTGLSKGSKRTRGCACLAAALLTGAAPMAFADSAPGTALPGAAAIVFSQSVPCVQPTAAVATPHRRRLRRRIRHRTPVKLAAHAQLQKPIKAVVVLRHKARVRHKGKLARRRPAAIAPLLHRATSCETLHRDQLANLPQLIAALYSPSLGVVPLAPTASEGLDVAEPPSPEVAQDFAVLPSGISPGPGGPIAPFLPVSGASSTAPIGSAPGAPPTATGPAGVVILPPATPGLVNSPGPGEGGADPPSAPIAVGASPAPGLPGTGGIATPPTVASAVPEPSTWFLLLSGVALAGAQFRRRNRSVSPSAGLREYR